MRRRISIDTLILEMLILRQQRFRWAVAVSTLIGFVAGVMATPRNNLPPAVVLPDLSDTSRALEAILG